MLRRMTQGTEEVALASLKKALILGLIELEKLL